MKLKSHKQATEPKAATVLARFVCAIATALILCAAIVAQNPYENRNISRIDITFEGADRDVSAAEQFRSVAGGALGTTFSTVRVRDALERLYDTDKIVSASVQASLVGDNDVAISFIIKRKSVVKKVTVSVSPAIGDSVTEQDLRLQINLLSPGSTVSDRILSENSNLMLTYLRERGFFDARIDTTQKTLSKEKEVEVVFDVNPNAQAKVGKFELGINGFDTATLAEQIKLKEGTLFSRQKLSEDVEIIREVLRNKGFLAPRLLEPRVIYDGDSNTIDIEIQGRVGAVVDVVVDSEEEEVGDKTQTRLLPVKREGTLDYSAIVEGQRRLETYYQEKGYFFARVNPECSVDPAFAPGEASSTDNGTEELCIALAGSDLENKSVELKYIANLNRRLRLTDLILEGTDLFTMEEIQTVLQSQTKSILGFIPFFGYGRGYTSLELIQRDRATILSLLRELGYREAKVGITQGVSIDGEDLIITFVVREGRPTKIVDVSIEGNKQISTATLMTELPKLVSRNYSRAAARNGVRKLAQFYANRGYFYADVSSSIVEVPDKDFTDHDEVKIIYKIEDEGDPVFVNRGY